MPHDINLRYLNSVCLQLLERSLKMFIKTACCFPERITKKDYDSILCELQHSEKVLSGLLRLLTYLHVVYI